MRISRVVLIVVAAVGVRTAEAQLVGYGVAGPAGVNGFFGSSGFGMHAAGGGEVLAGGRVGALGEFGILGNSSSVLAEYSFNGVLHVPIGDQASPFVTGGYTRLSSGEGAFDGWNIGGGLDLWKKDRVGVRLEFRDFVRPDSRGTVQYWTFRGGVCFR